jgi:hypothetical protein
MFLHGHKDLKGIPLELAQHKIELDTTIPLAHQARYKLNPNHATIIKQDLYKLLIVICSICRGGYMVVTHSSNTQEK